MSNRRSFLFLITSNPWQSRSRGALDLLMTTAVLDQEVHLCFWGDGVLHLVRDQDGSSLGLKTLAQQLPALELYGVEHCYADRAALERLGLRESELLIPVRLLDVQELRALQHSCHVVEHCR